MSDTDMRLYRKRHFLIYLNSLLHIFFLIPVMFICFAAQAFFAGNTQIAFLAILLAAAVSGCLIFGIRMIAHRGYEKSPIQQYAIETKIFTLEELLTRLNRSINICTVSDDVFWGRDSKAYCYWCICICKSFGAQEVEKQTADALSLAIKSGLLPQRVTQKEASRFVRCQIAVVNKMNSSACKMVSTNAIQGLLNTFSSVNSVLDLSTGTLHIPALWGGYIALEKTYRAAISSLIEAFSEEHP